MGISAYIPAPLHPRLLSLRVRWHVARKADTHSAQHLLGHASFGTTDTYLDVPSLGEMAAAAAGASYGARTNPAGRGHRLAPPLEATAGIEPA